MEQDKKESILAAATRAFAKLGFKKASVDEIAKDAGVAKGTVYLACESKEDLFYQAVHREVRLWVAQVSRMIDPRVRADELLERTIRASLGYMDSRPLVRDLLVGLYSGLLPDWVEQLDELRALGRSNVEEILRLGIRQGLFRAELDVEEVARFLQDLECIAYIQWARRGEGAQVMERRARAGLDFVLNGLRARADQPDVPSTTKAKAKA